MKIVICASMSASKTVMEVAGELMNLGHEVEVPRNTEKYAAGRRLQSSSESIQAKQENDLIRDYYNKIKSSDAVLVVNLDKGGIKNYIGGNSFLELGFAHVLNKPVYLYNPVPKMSYTDEIITVNPTVINGDLAMIK